MDPNEEGEAEEVVDLTKQMKFKEYSSIEISTRDKFIKKIVNEGHADPKILWVASEKIHGSNFSVHYNGQVARYGRRTDFLSNEIPVPCKDPGEFFTESFYNARNLVSRFHNKLQTIFEAISKSQPNLVKYAIYGQYFGGNWPEQPIIAKPEKDLKSVQKGVYYTPNHEYFAFDIFVVAGDHAYWVDVQDIPKFLGECIPTVPIFAKGTFEEMLNINIKINSIIPELLGLPRIEDNIIEGMVLRPNANRSASDKSRIILKKKNAQFNEKASEPKAGKKEKAEKQMDPEIVPYLEELSKYLNFNRVESVVSKFPDEKNRGKLKQSVIKDILTDAGKDEIKLPDEPLRKKVLDELDKLVIKEVNSYFTQH